jgi:hypothetical protein
LKKVAHFSSHVYGDFVTMTNHMLLDETRAQVIETLTPFARMWDGNLGKINTTPHRIEIIPGAKPVFQRPYRAGKAGREVEKREIERMLSAEVIETATSEWASPVVLIT